MAVLLSVIGSKTHPLLRNLCAPEKPVEKSLEQLSLILKKHFDPKPLVIAERFYFHRRAQGTSETIAEYAAELRRLASCC